ncbi:MAG: hypothetical protein IJD69_03480 [Alphaproteobacteria bacterium]|nr:hypothetical protein [Alphaproteobacteria bacterium]
MKEKIIEFLRAAFPFLLTIGLWRLSDPFWNPAGVLAIIPIFVCSFVRPVNWFPIFSILMCLVIDYKFETVCYWIAMYCLFFAINGFQSFIDLTRMDKYAILVFMIFCGVVLLIQLIVNFTFANCVRAVWIFSWCSALYLPITMLIQRVRND